MTVRDRLLEKRDPQYQEFQSKLVPNIDPATIVGVRTPEMRQIAKEFFGSQEGNDFLQTLPHNLYEENLVHFFMIAMIKDFDECIKEVERFLPYVDCWPVSDQSSPKCFKKYHEKVLPYVKKWIESDHVYTSKCLISS